MPVDIISLFVALPIVALTVLGIYFLHREWVENHEEPVETEPSGAEGKLFVAATWLLAVVYIVMGVPKLSALSDVVHQFHNWGYSEAFMYVIGGAEFLGAVLLLIPRLRLFAVAGLSVIMMGAIYTHLAFDPAPMVLLPTTCLALLTFVGYESIRREWQESGSVREAAAR